MKNTAIKLSLRGIRSSFGRWMALFLIVFLSVGFYAGLKLCRPAFWQACQDYLQEQDFYDFRVFSSLGFGEDDIALFAEEEGVADAEGVKTKDLLVSTGETDVAYVFISMPEKINMPSLTAGRYPEKENECVADHRVFDESDIGKTITISDNNDSDDLDDLTQTEYTIVGLVNSPLYLNHDIGATSIGNGSLEGFIYIPEESFDTDYYTEIDVTLEDSGSFAIYSDAYDDLIDAEEDNIRDLAEEVADADYDDIVQDILDQANSRIDEANQRLEEKQVGTGVIQEIIESTLLPEMTYDEAVSQAEKNGVTEPEVYILTRDDNAGYVSFRSDTSIIHAIANVFPIFFIMIALLVCVTTMTRMVNEERTQIGTLKAMGCSEFSITMKYMLYACSATLFGWAAGYAAGTFVIPKAFWAAYSVLYDFTELPYVFDLSTALITLGVALAAIILSVWISCRSELLSMPAALIRPKAAKPGRRILLEHFTHLWNKLSFLRKATFRNMVRYKVRMIMMIIGTGCCTALIVTAFGVRDSMIHVGEMQFDDVQTYQLEASVEDGRAEETEEAISGISGVADTLQAGTSVVNVTAGDERMTSVTLEAFPDTAEGDDNSKIADFWDLKTWDGTSSVSLPEDGQILLSRRLAEKLGVDVGDSVTVEDDSGKEPKTAAFTVSGVFRNYISNYAFLSWDTWQETFGSDDGEADGADTILIRTDQDTDNVDESMLEEINSIDGVTSVTSLGDTLAQVDHTLSVLNYIIWLIIAFAGALTFVVIFNLTNINIAERSREIATVQVLGFYPRETRAYVLWENLVLAILASIIGLPLGYLFCRFVVEHILIDAMTFPVIILPVSYAASFILSVIFALIVNMFMRRAIRSVHMAESLKAVE